MIKEQDIETIETWKIFILTHSILFSTPTLWTTTNFTHRPCQKFNPHHPHRFFDPHQNFMDTCHPCQIWTQATHAIFLTHAKILQVHATHATHAKVWPTPPTNPHTHANHAPMPPTLFSILTLKWARVGCMKRGGYFWKRPHLHCFWLKK